VSPSAAELGSVIQLPALPTAPSMVRAFGAAALRAWQIGTEALDTTLLVLSELATNAVKETGPAIRPEGLLPHEPLEVVRVRIRILRSSAVVEVWDASTVAPSVNPGALEADSEVGRGLFLVGELAEQWGYYYPAVGGKVVWAQIATIPTTALAQRDARPKPRI